MPTKLLHYSPQLEGLNSYSLFFKGLDITIEQLLANLEFVAVLHYNANIKESKKNIFRNEVINVASDKITPPKEVIPGYVLSNKQVVEQGEMVVYEVNGVIYCSNPRAQLEIYTTSGVRVANTALPEGVYIVRAQAIGENSVISKVIVQ